MNAVFSLLVSFGHRIWAASLTKYVAVLLVAGIWMLFFDRYNLQSRQKMATQVETLKQDAEHYRLSLAALEHEQHRLTQDLESLERYAREKYYMKKNNEDVFVITDP